MKGYIRTSKDAQDELIGEGCIAALFSGFCIWVYCRVLEAMDIAVPMGSQFRWQSSTGTRAGMVAVIFLSLIAGWKLRETIANSCFLTIVIGIGLLVCAVVMGA